MLSSRTLPETFATSMRSPILIDFSSNRVMPLTKFAVIFCRPKPIPTPSAPPKTAKAVRSTPSADNVISMAMK